MAACSFLWFESMDTVWWNTLSVIKGALSSKVQREQLLREQHLLASESTVSYFPHDWRRRLMSSSQNKPELIPQAQLEKPNQSSPNSIPKARSALHPLPNICTTQVFQDRVRKESKLLYFIDLTKYQLLLCFSKLTGFVLRSKYWRSNSNWNNFSVFFS